MHHEHHMEEGNVLTCTVIECSYNQKEMCHAPSITVGDTHPTCDTFTTQPANQADLEMPDVQACHATSCRFNKNEDCAAAGITVAHHSDHADCLTYRGA